MPDLQGVLKVAEVLDLGSEEQVAELSESEEDDEEHDGKASQILGTSAQSGWQLGHRLVEADVLEDLKYHKSKQFLLKLITNLDKLILLMYIKF